MRRVIAWIVFFVCHTAIVACAQSPVKFIENKNQWPEDVDYSTRVPGGSMFIRAGSFQYFFLDQKKLEEFHERSHEGWNEHRGSEFDKIVDGIGISVSFIDANTTINPQSFGKSSEYYNYFLGTDTCSWASKAYGFQGFVYPSLYTGIDLKVYAAGQNVKYDFNVSPGASTECIAIAYDGSTDLWIDNEGDFHAKTTLVEIIEKKPIAYQISNGKKVYVPCQYRLDDNRLSFHFPNGYDSCEELTIDPILIFSTYSGSLADNWGSTATPGENGNLYSAGVTNLYRYFINDNRQLDSAFHGPFPATTGAFQTTYGGLYDIGILKYDSVGKELLYATYLGGSGSESPHSLVMNEDEELILLGTTSSVNFPTTANAFDRIFNKGDAVYHVVEYAAGSDIVLSRISKDGSSLLASTYIGGKENDGLNDGGGGLTRNYGDELRGDVITDEAGDVYVISVTASADFPKAMSADTVFGGGNTDAVLFRLDKSLSQLKYTLFLGGSNADAGYSIKFDSDKNIYVAGGTASGNFPVTAGAVQPVFGGGVDGWITKVSNNGASVFYSTFTGTDGYDQIYFLDLNSTNEVYVYGQTDGDFPVFPSNVFRNTNSGQFIQKFAADLSLINFSTVIGTGRGSPDISPTAFLVNDCNYIYLAGWGGEVNNSYWRGAGTIGLPVTADALQPETSGSDFYFMVLTDDVTEFLYGTFLGGDLSATHVDGGTSRFDKSGIVYHAVCSGCFGPYSDFPVTPGAWSSLNRSWNCNNAAFKFDLSLLKARLQTNSVGLDMPGLNAVCIPDKIVFQNKSFGGEQFEWNLGDGTIINTTDTAMIIHQYLEPDKAYTVWLKAVDKGTCRVKDSVSTIVYVYTAEAVIQDDDLLCEHTEYTLKASGGAAYFWTSEAGDFQSTEAMPKVSPADTTIYYVRVTEANGCIHKDTVQLDVIPSINPDFETHLMNSCVERPSVEVENLTDSLWSTDHVYFDLGDGTTSDATTVKHIYESDGVYEVKLIGVREAGDETCITENSESVPVFTVSVPNVITPAVKDGANDAFKVQYGDQGLAPGDFGIGVSLVVYNRWGKLVYKSSDYKNDWSADNLSPGIYYYEVEIGNHAPLCKSWLHVMKP